MAVVTLRLSPTAPAPNRNNSPPRCWRERMGRRTPHTLLALAAALIAGRRPAAAEAQQERPNVLVLMSDDQTAESLRVMPAHAELIGGRGAEFTRSFVNYALCCPSRATLFTGQYAHNHGVLSNQLPSGGYTRLDTLELAAGVAPGAPATTRSTSASS